MKNFPFGSPARFCIAAVVFLIPVTGNAIAQSDHDYSAIARSISETMREHHYNPAELQQTAFLEIEAEILALAEEAESMEAFLSDFQEIWRTGPFSHVQLRPAQGTAAELATHLDNLDVGPGAVSLNWNEGIAILTVNTMMGNDTIEFIDEAYAEISARETEALIIDLRENGGGAFAIRPLVEHVINTPLDAGVFISQSWNARMDRAPTFADVRTIDPWTGWSIRDFWADVETNLLTRMRFEPADDAFSGDVYVLVSSTTASAAELATDALNAAGATIIGETTEGAMLSQKIYDIPGGLHLSLPIADYYSHHSGRIEGSGVVPDIEADSETAMEVALELARTQQ